jgi:hypothetical protein
VDVTVVRYAHHGEVQEWLNWLVSKTSVAQATEGSNPSLSAKKITSIWALFFLIEMIGFEASGFAKQNIPRVRRSE